MLYKTIVPIFFACDDNYLPFLATAIESIKTNASREFCYDINILYNGIDCNRRQMIKKLEDSDFKLNFVDISERIEPLRNQLDLRDYYTVSIYFRIFIAQMFPQYKKALYLDADIIVTGDISELFSTDLRGRTLGVISDMVVAADPALIDYEVNAIGVKVGRYFNSGVLVMDLDRFRTLTVAERFVELLGKYHFATIAPDQDYLNAICRDDVLYIDKIWNTMACDKTAYNEPKLIHFNMFEKPWLYDDVRYGEQFWKYAEKTEFYDQIKAIRKEHNPNRKEDDKKAYDTMIEKSREIVASSQNFKKILFADENTADVCEERRRVLDRIGEYESLGGEYFFRDVEDDPPSRMLRPEEVDYMNRKITNKVKNCFARMLAVSIQSKISKQYGFEIEGAENLKNIKGGAIITSNHFSKFENLAVKEVADSAPGKPRLYRMIREGNYFMPGTIGFLFKYCDTLPISSNLKTMSNLSKAVTKVLDDGNFILVYPEQAMWYNYRKPRPYRIGAFYYAAKNNVPVIPCFVSMSEMPGFDRDGYPNLKYTVHVMKPIYPSGCKNIRSDAERMMQENYELSKAKYEEVYGQKLFYLCDMAEEEQRTVTG